MIACWNRGIGLVESLSSGRDLEGSEISRKHFFSGLVDCASLECGSDCAHVDKRFDVNNEPGGVNRPPHCLGKSGLFDQGSTRVSAVGMI